MKYISKNIFAMEYAVFMKKRPCINCQYYVPTREKQCSLFIRITEDGRRIPEYIEKARTAHDLCGTHGKYYFMKK